MPAPSDRLDSWKAIADYLGRDVRTLRRWEERGLPVRRVAGERGHSVFAFKSEIDEWLTRPESAEPPASPAQAGTAASGLWRHWQWFGGSVVVMAAFLVWKTLGPAADARPLEVRVTSESVVAVGSDGTERWRYDFPPEGLSIVAPELTPSMELTGERPGVFVATSFVARRREGLQQSGVLRWFSLGGSLVSSFSFDDRWTFAGRRFEGTWGLTDFRPSDATGQRRVAVAGHHYTWWPGVVTILDDQWRREGTFVNAGWVESVRWLNPDRLVIAGYHEARAGGMVAVLDARDMHGASPEIPGSDKVCDDCGAARPLAYVVLPPSELNLLTGSGFNRAAIEFTSAGIMATTSEVDRENNIGPMMGAVYEFTPALDLLRASYDSRYWDRHRVLEREGRISHTRESCPERDGPLQIQLWDRAQGWRTVPTRHQRSP